MADADLPQRVLLVRLARLGDVLFTSVALRALARALPTARIDYLTTGYCRDIVAAHPRVSAVHCFDRRWHLPGYLARKRALARALAAERYDLAIVFEARYSTRQMLARLLKQAGIPRLISRDTSDTDEESRVSLAQTPVHACERHAALLAGLGITADDQSYELHVRSSDREAARALLGNGDPQRVRIGIQMGCHYSMWPSWIFWGQGYKYHKTWPESSWIELCRRLEADGDVDLVLTGAGVERPIAERVAGVIEAAGRRRPMNLAGATSVGVLGGVLAELDLFISVDTGSMHMATALGVPTIALFGPTDPRRHGPYRAQGRSVVLQSGVACSPCKKRERKACKLNRCMLELDVERVYREARRLVDACAGAREIRHARHGA